MALASLMAQLGPSLKDFAGEYEWHPGPPPPLTPESAMEVLGRDRIQWTSTKGGASAVYERDTKNPTWFVGVDGSRGCCSYDNTGDIWVLESPGKPVKFQPKNADAPTVTAMMRDVPSAYESSTVAGSATSAIDKKQLDRMAKITPEMQAREQKKFEKQQTKDAEMMAIREAITNDRQKRVSENLRA